MAKKTKSKKESKTLEYLQESKEEIKKVTWPTKNQAIKMTILVLVVVLITALVIAFLDFVFSTGNRYLLDLAPADAIPTVEESVPVDLGATADAVSAETGEPSPLTVEVLPPDAPDTPDTPVTDQ